MLREKLEWNDNNYEVGLFTFYRDHEQVTKPQKKDIEKKAKGNAQLFKIKRKTTKTKDHLKRYQTEYMYWSLEKSHQDKDKLKEPQPRTNASEKKTQIKHQEESPEKKVDYALVNKFFASRNKNHNKSQMTLNKKNVNDAFKYDIHRDRTRMFIYRGETQRSNHQMEKTQFLMHKINDKNEDEQKQLRAHINPEKQREKRVKFKFKPQLNLYSNFVQLLVQKRKRQLNQKVKQKQFMNLHSTLQKHLPKQKPYFRFFNNTIQAQLP